MFDAVFYLMSVVDVDMAIVGGSILFCFVEVDDGVEEFVYTSSVGENCRNHRDSEKFS